MTNAMQMQDNDRFAKLCRCSVLLCLSILSRVNQ